jgi:hypothetical protein
MTSTNRAIKEAYIKTLTASTGILFDLANMNERYTDEECDAWREKGNAAAELLSRSIREYFDPAHDQEVMKATKKLYTVQMLLEKELNVQKDIVRSVNAAADLISVAEDIVIIISGVV